MAKVMFPAESGIFSAATEALEEGMQKVLSMSYYDFNGSVSFTNCFDQLVFGRPFGFTVKDRLYCV